MKTKKNVFIDFQLGRIRWTPLIPLLPKKSFQTLGAQSVDRPVERDFIQSPQPKLWMKVRLFVFTLNFFYNSPQEIADILSLES